jgi:hypothetical protein
MLTQGVHRLSGIVYDVTVDAGIAYNTLQGSDVIAVTGYDGIEHGFLLQLYVAASLSLACRTLRCLFLRISSSVLFLTRPAGALNHTQDNHEGRQKLSHHNQGAEA